MYILLASIGAFLEGGLSGLGAFLAGEDLFVTLNPKPNFNPGLKRVRPKPYTPNPEALNPKP